ncbi:alpha/beta hydrolase [Microcella sp.]|uniref:alpha/beta hydrolase n=1 Tax=Microcella sp. TaxID=1913979 RepID=UPI00299F5E8E|nr:alpha/beta hydrolase [Microcella sp.]MDX2025257.1 alpha/beta hydrolase [Microcella sp.]
MVNDDSPAFHPDLTRARFMPGTSATRGNRRLLRALTRIGRGRAPKGGELVTLGEGVTVRVHRPAGASATDAGERRPGILYLHGGGLIIGSAVQGDPLCRRLADELGAVAASVDYRKPPEHPYPAPLDDCYAALQWLAAQPDVDPARIAVIGLSAGGGLAASLALLARDRGEFALAGQVLAYPMLDDRTDESAAAHPRMLRLWNGPSNRLGWGMYLGAGTAGPGATTLDAASLEHAVPARRADLTGLAPAWIGVGTLDLFHNEDVEYARRLTEAGVPTELHVIEGAYHGFDASEPTAAVAVDFVQRQVDALRGMLAAR